MKKVAGSSVEPHVFFPEPIRFSVNADEACDRCESTLMAYDAKSVDDIACAVCGWKTDRSKTIRRSLK